MIPENYSQEEFLRDLRKLFNLYFTPDKTNPKNLIIEPRPDFYLNTALDWADKHDKNSLIEILPVGELDAKKYKFTYTEDGDYFNKLYQENFKELYGYEDYEINNDFIKSEKEVKVSLAPTILAGNSVNNGIVASSWRQQDNFVYKEFKAKPRILYWAGRIAASNNATPVTCRQDTEWKPQEQRRCLQDNVVWLSSAAAYERLQSLVKNKTASASNIHQVEAVENETYGGNIMAAGLLMVEDFIRAGNKALERWPDTELFLVPREPFDSLLRDLQGTPAYAIADDLGRPVWLADHHGGIDPLVSPRLVTRRSAAVAPLREVMQRFNRARSEDTELEAGLDLVASFPIKTSEGLLDRAALREVIRAGREHTDGVLLSMQRFEILDDDHALCIETWPVKNSAHRLNRWTRLVRRESRWFIESISEGLVEV